MTKRGPKTLQGKAAVRFNAVRHGLTSAAPVVTEFETAEQWQSHLHGFWQSLSPVGYLEELLVERIALAFWLLKRCEWAETEHLAVAQERIEEDVKDALSKQAGVNNEFIQGFDFDEQLSRMRSLVRALAKLKEGARGRTLTDSEVSLVAQWADLKVREISSFAASRAAELRMALLSITPRSTDSIRDELDGFAATVSEFSDSSPIGYLLDGTRSCLNRLEILQEKSRVEMDRSRRTRLLLDEPTMARLLRYESHHRRQAVQYLHELEALQSRRMGQSSPLARLDVQLLAEP